MDVNGLFKLLGLGGQQQQRPQAQRPRTEDGAFVDTANGTLPMHALNPAQPRRPIGNQASFRMPRRPAEDDAFVQTQQGRMPLSSVNPGQPWNQLPGPAQYQTRIDPFNHPQPGSIDDFLSRFR